MNSGVYKIMNVKNGKFYIGSAKDFKVRWNRHLYDLRRGAHCNIYIQRAYNKYGEGVFSFEIIEIVGNLLEREQYWIDKMRPYDFRIGYNISRKAKGGDNLTGHPNRDEIIKKIRNSMKAKMTPEVLRVRSERVMGDRNPNFGNKWSQETRKKFSAKKKGKLPLNFSKFYESGLIWWNNPTNRQLMSDRRTGSGNSFYGKYHNRETKQRISQVKSKQLNEKRKRGEKLASNSVSVEIDGVAYISLTEASKFIGVNRQTILNRAKNIKFPNYRVIHNCN